MLLLMIPVMILNIRGSERAGDDLVATVPRPHGSRSRALSASARRWLTRSPVHIVLIAIAALWLVPTVACSSRRFRPRTSALERLVARLLEPSDARELQRGHPRRRMGTPS
jgi:hypothetical protein